MSPIDPQRQRDRRVTIFIAIVTVLATITTAALVRVEFAGQIANVNWIAFGLFATLLFIGETKTALWLRFGTGGEVTPGYAFAYALALLGSPAGAVAVMAITTAYVDIGSRKPFRKILFNVATISLALSTGGLVLHVFGIDGAITEHGTIPLSWGVGILAGGTMVFVLNGLVMCLLLALHTGTSFVVTLRQGIALSMTADGALLALAPLFVVAVEFSLVLVPLLGVTSFIVFQSARHALHRAHEADHDSLTQLLNRRAFSDRLNEVLEPDGPVDGIGALLLLDLDGFKEINDRLGHQVGDSLLQGFAERLEREMPENAFAARLGGDEFAVLIPGAADMHATKILAFDLHNRLCRPLVVNGFPLSVSMSIGLAFAPHHGETSTDLLAAADIAMYRAKRFRTSVELYQTSSSSRERGRIGLLADLSIAIDEDQLDVHFQPQLDMVTGRIDTVEALLRWHHPRLGPVPPDEFIGLAEQTELIGPLTECVLRRAANELSTLRDHEVKLAVNISARSLQDRHFVGTVMRVLAETRFPANRLELEVTERALATETERSRFTIEALRESKIRIAIDDFGTGYSSFITLRDVPADRLKIDRTFITDIQRRREDLLIVKNVIELAHGLGLQVVAEGVETQDQWRILGDLGCDIAQGYGIAMPMSILDLRAWVAERRDPTRRSARLMILVWVTCIGVASALFTLTHVRRLAELPIRHLWLVWVALIVQVVLFEYFGQRIAVSVSDKIHLATYALALTFIWLNRRLPGGWMIALGTTFNLSAIVANGGTMPANPTAWSRAGMPAFSPEVFENSRALSSPRLAILGDVFYVPASWPLSNVFSIGDVLIVVGSTYLAHRWCSKPRGRELATVIDQIEDVDGVAADRASAGAHDLV